MNAKQALFVMKNKGVSDEAFLIYPKEDLIKFMHAWESSGVQFLEPEGESPSEDPYEQWKWLWKCSFASMEKVKALYVKDMPQNFILSCMRWNLIFPDGTSNFNAFIKKEDE